MKHYADSSFLVSCYIADRNTAAAKAWLLRARIPLPFTELHALEVRNAFHLGVFRGLITPADIAGALANLRSDLRTGRLRRQTINWTTALRIAATISGKHTSVTGARSLDILHVAAAKSLQAHELISFDTRQRLLAIAVGMSSSP
ncbi:MAG TPA: type II toxin-antitoxin system VapC family toxin [Humisphaera sp.]|nr:type II toxin-antitoxin system VapC family toxin [Humisphaera sp.]